MSTNSKELKSVSELLAYLAKAESEKYSLIAKLEKEGKNEEAKYERAKKWLFVRERGVFCLGE